MNVRKTTRQRTGWRQEQERQWTVVLKDKYIMKNMILNCTWWGSWDKLLLRAILRYVDPKFWPDLFMPSLANIDNSAVLSPNGSVLCRTFNVTDWLSHRLAHQTSQMWPESVRDIEQFGPWASLQSHEAPIFFHFVLLFLLSFEVRLTDFKTLESVAWQVKNCRKWWEPHDFRVGSWYWDWRSQGLAALSKIHQLNSKRNEIKIEFHHSQSRS